MNFGVRHRTLCIQAIRRRTLYLTSVQCIATMYTDIWCTCSFVRRTTVNRQQVQQGTAHPVSDHVAVTVASRLAGCWHDAPSLLNSTSISADWLRGLSPDSSPVAQVERGEDKFPQPEGAGLGRCKRFPYLDEKIPILGNILSLVVADLR